MKSSVTGSFQLMKSLNRSLVLNTIRVTGTIPRSEIAKKTKLTPATVTNIVNELLKEGIVLETTTGKSSGGRKPILLTINSSSKVIIGVDVGVKKIRFAVSDLGSTIHERKTVSMPDPVDPNSFMLLLKETLETLIQSMGDSRERLLGIGIAMHGIVDSEKGFSLHAPTMKLDNVPIKDLLEAQLGIPVRVENDAKALALGEEWFGHGELANTLVCLNIGEGIGAGIIFNRELYNGLDSLAGEIGHTIIDIDGPKCSCGNYGCFQALASGEALRERALREISLGRDTILLEKTEGDLSQVDGLLIYECALEGDSLSIEVLEQTARYIGIGLVNIIHFLNPALIILGGGVSRADKFILPPIKEVMESKVIAAHRTKVLTSKLGQEGSLIGAITLVLSELFNPEHSRSSG